MSVVDILYVGGFEMPDKNAAAHRVLSNGKIFRELGYNVIFIDVDKNLSFNTDILSTYKNVQGFDCWSVPYPKTYIDWIKYLSNIASLKVIARKYSNIKFVIAYNYPALALRNLKLFCKKNEVRIIADCTEWYSTKGTNVVFKIIKGLDSFLRMRIIQKQMDGLIVISKYLEQYYADCKNVVRIPPLVDINEQKWRFDLSEQHENKDMLDKIRLIYSGNPGKNKDKLSNIVDSLNALNHFDNYLMEIVGISKDDFLVSHPDYKEKIEILGSKISFVGKISHIESLKKLKNSDYSIFIRDKTRVTMAGFPTKFVESITCSTSVITIDVSDLRDYLSDDLKIHLIKNDSVANITKVLESIFSTDKSDSKQRVKQSNDLFHFMKYHESMRKLLSDKRG